MTGSSSSRRTFLSAPAAAAVTTPLLGVAAAVPVLAARILDEEKMLNAELAGYREYTQQVRYRLIPAVW